MKILNDLTYLKDGLDVKTSKFLKNKGTCCKTSCLHCPYGFTLKKEGLSLEVISNENFETASLMAKKVEKDESSLASSMLASAFGPTKKSSVFSEKSKHNYLLVKIKGEVCALVRKRGLRVTEIVYAKHFEDQGITTDIVSSFLS